jgi:hypothetical protein
MGAHLVPATSLRLHEVVFFQAVARDVGKAGDNIAEDIVSATTGRLTWLNRLSKERLDRLG